MECTARQRLHTAHDAFDAADDAWHNELLRLYGRAAGDVRYTKAGRGEVGTELRRLYEARNAARRAYNTASDAVQAVVMQEHREAIDPWSSPEAAPYL